MERINAYPILFFSPGNVNVKEFIKKILEKNGQMKGLLSHAQFQDRKGEDATMNEKHRKHLAAFSERLMLALFGE